MSNFLGIVLILFSLCKLSMLNITKINNAVDKVPNRNDRIKLSKILTSVIVFDIALGITCGCIILLSL
nr:MAG TPA: hypothetical protein [Caudoviricetes sp.]